MALTLFLLSNLYAEVRRWSYVSKVKEVMKERELEKDLVVVLLNLAPGT
jgi:hypothetical protein